MRWLLTILLLTSAACNESQPPKQRSPASKQLSLPEQRLVLDAALKKAMRDLEQMRAGGATEARLDQQRRKIDALKQTLARMRNKIDG